MPAARLGFLASEKSLLRSRTSHRIHSLWPLWRPSNTASLDSVVHGTRRVNFTLGSAVATAVAQSAEAEAAARQLTRLAYGDHAVSANYIGAHCSLPSWQDAVPSSRSGEDGGRQQSGGRGGESRQSAPDNLTCINDLRTLAVRVKERAPVWARKKNVSALVAAFSRLAKVGTSYGANPTLCRQVFNFLTAIYLPLVPDLKTLHTCLTPLWAAAKLGYWNSPLPTALLRKLGAGTDTQGYDPTDPPMLGATEQEHAMLWQALARAPQSLVGYAMPLLQASAAGLLAVPPRRLGSQTCATVLLAASRLRWRDAQLLHRLTVSLGARPDAKNQELANALFALGNLAEDCGHVPRGEDLRQIAVMVVRRLRTGQEAGSPGDRQGRQAGQEKGARAGSAPAPLRHQHVNGRTFTTSGLSTATKGSSAGDPSRQGRGSGVSPGSWAFGPLDLSQMLLGCSKLGGPPPVLLVPLAKAAGGAAARMSEQQLTNSLSALAKLGCTDPAYASAVEDLCAAVRGRLRGGRCPLVPHDISSVLSALEALRPVGHQELAEALANECLQRRFGGFNTQDLCQTVWALAKMGWADPAWYDASAAAASEPGAMAGAKPQEWSGLWYALALARHRPKISLVAAMVGAGQAGGDAPDARPAVAPALEALRTHGSAQTCANMLWALAMLRLCEAQLVDALAERLEVLLKNEWDSVEGRHLVGSLWALAVMGPEMLVRHGRLVRSLLLAVFQRWKAAGQGRGGPAKALGMPALRQLWQVQVECLAVGTGLERVAAAWGEAPASLLQVLQRVRAQSRGQKDETAAEAQQQVVACLGQLQQRQQNPTAATVAPGAQHRGTSGRSGGVCGGGVCGPILEVRLNQRLEGLGWKVDMLVELEGGRRVALQVDGPSEFLASGAHLHRQHGATRLRDRQLARVFGTENLVVVPSWEWSGLEEVQEREAYLCDLLGFTAGERQRPEEGA